MPVQISSTSNFYGQTNYFETPRTNIRSSIPPRMSFFIGPILRSKIGLAKGPYHIYSKDGRSYNCRKMRIIDLNMVNTIKATLEGQHVNQQRAMYKHH